MTKKDVKGDKIVAHFLTFTGREAYSSLKTLAYPEKPISLPYATLKEPLLNRVKCTSFECCERAKFHKMVRQNDQKVRSDMKRLASLTNEPSPKNLTELCSLVGALQYYSRFIPNFSCRANCLLNILASNSFKSTRSSAAMVQRWSIAMSAYDYTVQHRSVKQIQHVDYISRRSLQDRPVNTSDCLLVQPLTVERSYIMREISRYFGCILSAIRKGWNANLKRRFPIYFSERDELSTTPDGILCLNDRVVIPPSLRKSVLEDLHNGHLVVEKMKSLASLT
ncbi:unnamed protein product [Schistosoma mattheei]|uniref:Uncharacterized protein n=1 Tax=Schistosoma mattheei TaxID=31246 RepID=A0A183NUY5_9TREM|nr:unnamed protein product [Schistosoma mattheei]